MDRDHYAQDNLGLAGPRSTPDDEVSHLLGSPFEHITVSRRHASYTATVVLDLAAILEVKEVFEVAVNDFLAVHAMPTVLEVGDTCGQYVLNAEDIRSEPNMQYCETWAPVDEWKVAPHHKAQEEIARWLSTHFLDDEPQTLLGLVERHHQNIHPCLWFHIHLRLQNRRQPVTEASFRKWVGIVLVAAPAGSQNWFSDLVLAAAERRDIESLL